MRLNFLEGLLVGIFITACVLSVIIDNSFVSKDTLTMREFYYKGNLVKLCEVR